MEIFGVPSQAFFGQLLLGLINGSFYAVLSLGLAVIFGLLNIINFAHGAQYMLGAFAGVLAAPIQQVNPVMGSNLIIVVFAVVVIGGMGSILGAIVTGLGLGIVEGLTKVFYPEASAVVIFLIMVLVLLVKPAGLFGKQA